MHRLTDIHAHALSTALWVTHASGAGGCPFTNLHFHSLLEIWVLQHCVPLQLPTALWGSCLQGPCRHIKVGPHMWPPPGSRQLVEAHRKAAVLQGNVWRCQTRPWLLLFLVPSFLMMQFYFILFFSSWPLLHFSVFWSFLVPLIKLAVILHFPMASSGQTPNR